MSASSTGAIRYWVVGATGFRQDSEHESGMELLWREMRRLKTDGVCVTTPYQWDDDAQAKAAFIARNSAPGAVVLMYAYSYGVGSFCTEFAQALDSHGIRIARLISVDGIRRMWALKWRSLRWFAERVAIQLPANIDVAYRFYQSEDALLRGHRLVAADPSATEIIDWQLHGCDHYCIDDNTSMHQVALTEFSQVIDGEVPA